MWVKICSPAGHFLCLAAAAWLHVDHSRPHVGTPPPHCGWGNTWSQPLQLGSWAEALAIIVQVLFVDASGVIQCSWGCVHLVQAGSLYLVARDHTSPEGCVHKTLPCRLLQLLVEMTECGGWRNAVSEKNDNKDHRSDKLSLLATSKASQGSTCS